MSDETIAETVIPEVHQRYNDIIAERRRHIRDSALCECGTTLAACEANRGKDPTAPVWFGCCARGTALVPCRHEPSVAALQELLDEIAAGHVRAVSDLQPKRHAARPIAGLTVDQGEWWQQKNGSWIRVDQMSPGHRYNSAAMILREAATIGFRYSLRALMEAEEHDGGDMAQESLDRIADELSEKITKFPREWMMGTPIYRALTAGLTIQGDGTQPWQATRRDPVTGEETDVPPRHVRVCEIPACGCSGEAHA